MFFWLIACGGGAPEGLEIGPVALPAAEHAIRVPMSAYAAFADPAHVPNERELARCLDGEPVDHAWAVLELRADGARLSGRPVSAELLDDSLLAMVDSTRAVAAAGCGAHTGRLLLVADQGTSFGAVIHALYTAAQAGFGDFDVLVDDPTPSTPSGPTAPGRSETLLLRPGGASLSGREIAPGALAAALGQAPVDLTLAVQADMPFGEVLAAHDAAAATGGRVAWGLGDGLDAGPIAPAAGAERVLAGDVAVLRVYTPRPGDGWLLQVREGP